jgi:hypothetical protein
MYKRRLRVVFAEVGSGSRARRAAIWAGELGGDWLAPEAVALSGEDSAAGTAPQADLVVLLVAEDTDRPAERVGGIRLKRWPLGADCADPGGPEPGERCDERIRRRVAGLLGGLRMKAREDAGE